MTVTYIFEKNLYVNITNRCSNCCDFCVRTNNDGYYSDSTLWLEREPTVDEVIEDITSHDLSQFDELVFCGYGEPTYRLFDMIKICEKIKAFSNIKIRVNTNGQASLICGYDVTEYFGGHFDVVSVSLNTATPSGYQQLCHSNYGESAYDAILEFAAKVRHYVPEVYLSVVKGTIPDEDIDVCRQIAESCGVKLKVRDLV